MTQRAGLYFGLAAVGLLSQVGISIAFFADSGFDLGEFADQATGSTIAVLTLADLVLCGVIFLVWSYAEARRVGIDPWWPFAVATAGGICFALPLFLGYRERRLQDPAGVATGRTSPA